MYKVFFKESIFLLTDNQNLIKTGTISLIHNDFNATKAFVWQLLGDEKKFTAVICHDDVEVLFSIFKSCFLYAKAAGGVVRKNSEILIIKRLGMYDLPKGHLEVSETIEQCAIREVEEECGIRNVEITSPLANTFHIYYQNAGWYLKKTYWFNMTCPSGQSLHPQTEEDIEDVFWLPVSEIDTISDKTYSSLKDLFSELS